MASTGSAKTVKVDCPRCNGRGGWEGWPEFTCYLCRGTGYRLRSQSQIRQAATRKVSKIRTDHCVHADHDVTTARWFWMKGSELWCGECFNAFKAGQR